MVNDIIVGLSQTIEKYFDNVEIHMERLPQGFCEPCFFIRTLHCSQKQIIGDRYFRTQGFNIRYYPRGRNLVHELNKVADILLTVLEYISLPDGEIRGTEMRSEIRDDILHFFVNYDLFVLKARDRGALMRILKQTQGIKRSEKNV